MVDAVQLILPKFIDHKKTLVVSVVIVIYLVALLNKILYEFKIYRLDLAELKQKKKSEVARITTEIIRLGTQRYAPQISEGMIRYAEQTGEEQILRRKLKFRHDIINSFATVVTQFFKK